MGENKDYKEIYDRYIAYEESSHEKNQRKIRVGLKVNILLPMVFLIISFLTQGSKLVFLILWIVSLFGIAAYLINVEYRDYRMQERLKLFAGEEGADDLTVGGLIGDRAVAVEEKVTDRIDIVDERIAQAQEQMAEKLREVVRRRAESAEGPADGAEEPGEIAAKTDAAEPDAETDDAGSEQEAAGEEEADA